VPTLIKNIVGKIHLLHYDMENPTTTALDKQ
jgi:hypothetical protein